jgi:hypothetical protein
MRKSLFVALFAALLAGSAGAAVPPEEGKRVVELTHQLEAAPLADDASGKSNWLLEWITQSPDVSVSICDTLQILGEKKYAYGPELVKQTMFGMASYLIEHPDAKGESVEVQVAGVRSALKAYAAIVAQHPEGKLRQLDDLAAHEAAGDLPEFMKGVMAKKCKAG